MARKDQLWKLLVIRYLTDKDLTETEGPEDKITTPGAPQDFRVRVLSNGNTDEVGAMWNGTYCERVALTLKRGGNGQEGDKLLRLLEAMAPFFPDATTDNISLEDMFETLATHFLQQGIELGLQIAAGKIIPAELEPAS
jgi:hypothetical protein